MRSVDRAYGLHTEQPITTYGTPVMHEPSMYSLCVRGIKNPRHMLSHIQRAAESARVNRGGEGRVGPSRHQHPKHTLSGSRVKQVRKSPTRVCVQGFGVVNPAEAEQFGTRSWAACSSLWAVQLNPLYVVAVYIVNATPCGGRQ